MVREENQPRLLRVNAFIGDVTAGSRQDVTSQSPFILPVAKPSCHPACSGTIHLAGCAIGSLVRSAPSSK